jgi:RHS repeat-associated protein
LTNLSYDALNRLTDKSYSGTCSGTAVHYTYDIGGGYGIGKRTSMTDATGSVSWIYDKRGRLTSETKVVTGQGTFLTQWAYNFADLQTWIVYPADNLGNAGEQVYSTYNSQMALQGLGNIQLSTNYVYNTQYDEAGRVRLRQLGRNTQDLPILQAQYNYNAWTTQGGRLQTIQAGPTGTPTALLNLSYSYDVVGNVLNIQDYIMGSPQTQSFGYDSLNRLTSAGASGGNDGIYGPESYSYDPTTGNLAIKAGVSYSYLAQNSNCPDGALSKAHAVTTAGANAYCYDRNGNMVRRNIGLDTYNLAYDAENRLTQVSGAATATFGYDGDGQRVIGTEGGATTVYIGNYFEWKGSASTMVKYYYAGAVRVAMRTGMADPLWLFGDHLSSTSAVASYDGSLYGRQGYKAWGEQRFPAGDSPLPTTFRFTGQRESASFGMYYYGARWYDSSLGRFIQPDTIIPEKSQGVQAWDRYAYVNNNPIRYNDPSGHGNPDPRETGGESHFNFFTEMQKRYNERHPTQTLVIDFPGDEHLATGTPTPRPTPTPSPYVQTPTSTSTHIFTNPFITPTPTPYPTTPFWRAAGEPYVAVTDWRDLFKFGWDYNLNDAFKTIGITEIYGKKDYFPIIPIVHPGGLKYRFSETIYPMELVVYIGDGHFRVLDTFLWSDNWHVDYYFWTTP